MAGKQIPVFSRIATVVDVYDAATSQRVYQAAKLPVHALYRNANRLPRILRSAHRAGVLPDHSAVSDRPGGDAFQRRRGGGGRFQSQASRAPQGAGPARPERRDVTPIPRWKRSTWRCTATWKSPGSTGSTSALIRFRGWPKAESEPGHGLTDRSATLPTPRRALSRPRNAARDCRADPTGPRTRPCRIACAAFAPAARPEPRLVHSPAVSTMMGRKRFPSSRGVCEMKFIEMSGKTLLKLVNDEEMTRLAQRRHRRAFAAAGQSAGRYRSAAAKGMVASSAACWATTKLGSSTPPGSIGPERAILTGRTRRRAIAHRSGMPRLASVAGERLPPADGHRHLAPGQLGGRGFLPFETVGQSWYAEWPVWAACGSKRVSFQPLALSSYRSLQPGLERAAKFGRLQSSIKYPAGRRCGR